MAFARYPAPAMHIEANAFVTLDYVLSGESGEVLDDSRHEGGSRIEYVHRYGMLVPGLESELTGLKTGEERDIDVVAEDGYGLYDEDLVFELDRSELDSVGVLQVGDELSIEGPDGEHIECEVLEVGGDRVVLDANHPLAGQKLRYHVEVIQVRMATPEEIEMAAANVEESLAEHAGGCCGGAHDHGHGHDGEPAVAPVQLIMPGRGPRQPTLN